MENLTACTLIAWAVLAQSIPPDWSHMASLPFAFAAASFLIWSMVSLVRMLFDSWKQTNTETINTLREQVSGLRKFQDDTLVGMINKVTSAMEKDADSSLQSSKSWSEVHEDFRDLISALRVRPCLHDSDLPPPEHDDRTLAAIQRRRDRETKREEG